MNPLGIYAKSSSQLAQKNPFEAKRTKAGAVIQESVRVSGFLGAEKQVPEKEYNPVLIRLERYAMQSAARKILKGSKIKRIGNCLRLLTGIPENPHLPESFMTRPQVRIYRRGDHSSCSYGGLQTCASVWCCAVCAAKISERRKNELQQAIEQHNGAGGEVLMLTLTSPHYRFDKLSDVVDLQREALKHFNSGKSVLSFNRSIFYIGQIRALEVTHGRLRLNNNGWHPHYHILLFVRDGLNLGELRKAFYSRWVKACFKADMPVLPDFKHGVRLDNGAYASAYASKWGLENEMTKGHIKKANNGETPFDFLRSYLSDDDKQAAALFREFSEVFKGKRQLFWSHGLKENFYIVDKTDDEIAAESDSQSHLLGSLSQEDWSLILQGDIRGHILELARHGWDPVERFLLELRLR